MTDNDTLVVSFCNVTRWAMTAAGGVCVARIGPGGLERSLHTQDLAPNIGGATGLCLAGHEIVCMLQHPIQAVMCKLNRDLTPLNLTEVASVSRPHSVCMYKDDLYIVSTGSDAVTKIDPSGASSTFWKMNDLMKHTVHLNSICVTPDGCFYGSAFGHPGGPVNWHRKLGYVIDFSSGKKITTGLSHPHSVTWSPNGLLFCHSAGGSLCDTHGTVVSLSNNYPRGMAITPERIYIGVSARRTASISQSSTILQVAQHERKGAEVVVFSWQNHDLRTAREIRRIPLGEIANEIFDIIVL